MDKASRAEELCALLTLYQTTYYKEGRSLVSDLEYDRLFDELAALENENPSLRKPDSPTQRVGSDLSSDFPEVSHSISVLSLDKAYSTDAIYSFIEKTNRSSSENLSYVLEEKIDGFSIVLYYRQGILDRAVTRGNGFVGNDVTANVRTIRDVPLKLAEPVDIAVRGEVYLPIEEFERINVNLEEPYANPRNLAAGTIRRNKSSETARVPLSIFVYEGFWNVTLDGNPSDSESIGHYSSPSDHIRILGELKRLGFAVDSHIYYFCRTLEEARKGLLDAGLDGKAGTFSDIPQAVEHFTDVRRGLPYEIDGLVLKVNELQTREVLGYTGHHPRWAIAYKFESPQAQSVVQSIDVQIGRTGRVTPMARIQDTQLSGSTIRNITLHNQDYVNELELAVGDTVAISKRGDVIPAVENVVEKNTMGNTTWVMPSVCPVCGSVLEKRGAHHFCTSSECPSQVKGRMAFFCAKGQMDIEGLGPRTIEILYDNGFCRSISDLYSFDYSNLYGLEGFGTEGESKKVKAIKKAIAESRKAPFRRVLVALGIPEFGKKAVDLVVDNGFDSMQSLLSLASSCDYGKLSSIYGLGDVTAHTIIDSLNSPSYRSLIQDLMDAGLSMSEEKVSDSDRPRQIFAGQSWCVTGSFENFNPRSKAMEEIKRRGGVEVSSVSRKTSCLLAGSAAGSKLDKAMQLGVRIVSEEEFLAMISSGSEPGIPETSDEPSPVQPSMPQPDLF